LSVLEGPFLGDAGKHFGGPLWVARDGDLVTLPRAGGMLRRNLLS
jgi:ribonuclease Z